MTVLKDCLSSPPPFLHSLCTCTKIVHTVEIGDMGAGTEEVSECKLPGYGIHLIWKLEAEHRTDIRNKMEEKDTSLNLPSHPEP